MITTKGYPDVPVLNLGADLFEVSVYVDSLADFILTCQTPMTIAIQGDWGSGKTSMMNMVKEHLGTNVITVWFNTWQFSQFNMSANLPISLLTYLTDTLCEGDIDNKSRFVASLGKVLKGTGKLLAKMAIENVAGGTAASLLDTAVEENINYAKEISNLKKLFEDSVKARLEREKKDRIVIFIDDLDRLAPETAVEVLEVLKLFLDVENCVYLLAIDYDVVTQGINKKFGETVSREKGKSFFDKIIQLPFKLPVNLYNLDSYVKNMLDNFGIATDNAEILLYKGLIVKSIGKNPRSIKRLFNSFQLIKTVVSRRNPDTANNSDMQRILFAVLCMQMAFDDLYEYLLLNKQSFYDENFFNIATANDMRKLLPMYLEGEGPDAREMYAAFDFYKEFLSSINRRSDMTLSEEQINLLVNLLSFSAITATVHINSESDQQGAWRKHSRLVAKEIEKLLDDKYQTELFHVYQEHEGFGAGCVIDVMFKQMPTILWVGIDIDNDQYMVGIVFLNKNKKNRNEFEATINKLFSDLNYSIDDSDNVRINCIFIKKEPLGISTQDIIPYPEIAEKYVTRIQPVMDRLMKSIDQPSA